jgi:hypothetical protein
MITPSSGKPVLLLAATSPPALLSLLAPLFDLYLLYANHVAPAATVAVAPAAAITLLENPPALDLEVSGEGAVSAGLDEDTIPPSTCPGLERELTLQQFMSA